MIYIFLQNQNAYFIFLALGWNTKLLPSRLSLWSMNDYFLYQIAIQLVELAKDILWMRPKNEGKRSNIWLYETERINFP